LVDKEKIAVIGHSRGGKMALIAAALDKRVAAVIASHNGAGAGTTPPWRYLGEKFGGETLESSTLSFPYWNHPRLRFFAGRENKLPFDSHFMMALVAPRPFLVTEGYADDVCEPWATQQAYLATKEVYTLLGHPERLNIAFHPGSHRLPEAIHDQYVDWLDVQFGRTASGQESARFLDQLMYTYTFEKWQALTGAQIDLADYPKQELDGLLVDIQSPEAWQGKREAIRKNILWALGELPPKSRRANVELTDIRSFSSTLDKAELPIEGKLVGHLTYPAHAAKNTAEKLPVVIYLHAYLDVCGYAWSAEYGWATSVGERLAQKGFLAVEYDQFGYGARNHDSGHEFYEANPRQSAMGVMVQDLRSMIDALCELPVVDPKRIMVAGFSLGATVALYAAALDERIAAVASTSGFASMRLDRHGQATEGLMRYSHLRPTLPRLGHFVGNEKRVPYDFHEIIALIAPRPVLIVAPRLDQDFFFEDVQACYTAASAVYKLLDAEDRLRLESPDDFNRYPPHYQHLVNNWLYHHANNAQ
jgi:dienelactone hydrolase